jgi:cytidylate kinase
MVVVAIGGPPGSGKTTVAKALLKRFRQLRYVSAGEIFRQLAEEKGKSLCEFSRYAESHPEIDRMIDRRTSDAAMDGKVLIDARLAGWMAKKADIKILITAPVKVRAKRIARREGRRYKSVLEETLKRERSEAKRFKKFYNIDVNNNSPYDMVLNTERLSRQETERIVGAVVDAVMKRRR